MFCFHKYGKIDNDNIQYCEKCGKARRIRCGHIWVKEKEYDFPDQCSLDTYAIVYVMKCKKCGDRKQERIYA